MMRKLYQNAPPTGPAIARTIRRVLADPAIGRDPWAAAALAGHIHGAGLAPLVWANALRWVAAGSLRDMDLPDLARAVVRELVIDCAEIARTEA